jgi:dihydroxy-acid dehydratase
MEEAWKYSLPCIGDGKQSGTSGPPCIFNASPEAVENGNLAILKDGEILRVDLNKRKVNMIMPASEIETRRAELMKKGGYAVVKSQTPYQDLFRRETGPLNEGMVFKRAISFQGIVQNVPGVNHCANDKLTCTTFDYTFFAS